MPYGCTAYVCIHVAYVAYIYAVGTGIAGLRTGGTEVVSAKWDSRARQ